MLGGVTCRLFPARSFAQIVFCVLSSDQRVEGYGVRLISSLKDYVRANSPIMHFLIYADNFAIGFFKKQGFTKEITLDKSRYVGFIQEFEGATMMQCSIAPQDLTSSREPMLQKQQEAGTAEIKAKSHIVHDKHGAAC